MQKDHRQKGRHYGGGRPTYPRREEDPLKHQRDQITNSRRHLDWLTGARSSSYQFNNREFVTVEGRAGPQAVPREILESWIKQEEISLGLMIGRLQEAQETKP